MSQQTPIILAGISTEVGKTVVSAIVVEKLKSDYWKPVQAGELDDTDTMKVQKWISNTTTVCHSEGARLEHPMSPHAAADLEGNHVAVSDLILPETANKLVVELAGGILVPINHNETNVDLMKSIQGEVILVANYYLGSINHTLLTIKHLQEQHIPIRGIIFNGDPNTASRDVILEMTGCKLLGEIPFYQGDINPTIIKEYGTYLDI